MGYWNAWLINILTSTQRWESLGKNSMGIKILALHSG